MNNLAINEVTNNMVQRDFDDKYHIRVALPSDASDDTNDNSKKAKKSLRRAIQKQMQAPPKLDKYTTSNMAPIALANVYQNLTNEQKEDFLEEIVSQNGAMAALYTALPDSAKNEFLATVTRVLIKKAIEIYQGLSTDDQKQLLENVNNFIESMPPSQREALLSQSKQTLDDPWWNNFWALKLKMPDTFFSVDQTFNDVDSYDNGDINSGITNIMMILVQIFCQSMNVESMDMLQQIQDSDFQNKFMEIQKQALEKNIANLDNPAADSKKWYQKWGVKLILAIVIVAVVAFTLYPLLVAAPEIAAGAEIVTQTAAEETAAGVATAVEETASTAAEDAAEIPIGEGDDDVEMQSENDDVDLQPPEIDDEPIEPEQPQQTQGAKAEQQIENDQAAQEDDQEAIRKAEQTQNTGNDGPKKMRKRTFSERVRYNYENKLDGGLGLSMRGLKFLFLGGAGFFGANLALGQYWPKAFMGVPKQESPTKLQEYSQKAQLSGGIVDQINNKLQLDSRNESNDSDKVNQFAQFVNQAINMYGQAFVTRT